MSAAEILDEIQQRAKLADSPISAINEDRWGLIHVARAVRPDDTERLLAALRAVLKVTDAAIAKHSSVGYGMLISAADIDRAITEALGGES